jgi:hypothetical protein
MKILSAIVSGLFAFGGNYLGLFVSFGLFHKCPNDAWKIVCLISGLIICLGFTWMAKAIIKANIEDEQ